MSRSRLARAGALLLALTACNSPRSGPSPLPGANARVRAPASAAPEFVGFWESWSDTKRADAFHKLGSVPSGVTTIDVAFSIADGNEISRPQNTYPLKPGARRIHAHGGKLLLSFGGATSPFDITDPDAFAANLQKYAESHRGLYDGFDFDQGSPDDCRLDVLAQFANIEMRGSGTFPQDKIVLGLMIGAADDGVVISPRNASGYGDDVRKLGYRGIMIWDLDRDNPQPPPSGTGHPKGTYVRDISKALGT